MNVVPIDNRIQYTPANRSSFSAPKTFSSTQPTVSTTNRAIITIARSTAISGSGGGS